jgi:hypothetical protein
MSSAFVDAVPGLFVVLAVLVLGRLALEWLWAALRARRGRFIVGTASGYDETRWPKNPDGPRTEAEAETLAKAWGVHVPEDVQLLWLPDDDFSTSAHAEYGIVGTGINRILGTVTISRRSFLYTEVTGKIPVRFRRYLLESDFAIVEIVCHEMHEINELLRLFRANDDYLSAGELSKHIDPDQPGNLHHEAVARSEQLLNHMKQTYGRQSEGPSSR